jgi:pyruvate-ferredoxin/flavodoxin oxidoreductase
VYVATVAMGADDTQTVKAFMEAEAYEGTSIIIAYSHCIAHGIDMTQGMNQQRLIVDSGRWPLYRYHPDRADSRENPFELDSKPPAIRLEDEIYNETRYRILAQSDPEQAERYLRAAQEHVDAQRRALEALAEKG